ncbi:ROK family protein [Streptomyces sp. TRM68416]|uniref:ROK family protein n=1 Tax=Streptomyces sp. TRM68416 TaxID=2758412 RepID=UPI001661E6D8|nr:ROK family protein [Streptomyces sp. TRM68416]
MTRPAHGVAVDPGGTTIKAARSDAHGTAEETLRLPTPSSKGPDAVVAAVVQAATAYVRPGVGAVGRCAAGLIDTDAGIVRFASNPGLRDTPLAAAVHLPVTLEHDVRAACLAERQPGFGAGLSDLLVVVPRSAVTAAPAVARSPPPTSPHAWTPTRTPPASGGGDGRPRQGARCLDLPARPPAHRPGGRNGSGRRSPDGSGPPKPATGTGPADRTRGGDISSRRERRAPWSGSARRDGHRRGLRPGRGLPGGPR